MIDLDQLNKEEHYKIPDGYFDQLPNQIMNNIRKEKRHKRNLWISSVAVVALLIICGTIFINYNKEEALTNSDIAIADQGSESQLEEQMADYYSGKLAQMDYYNY